MMCAHHVTVIETFGGIPVDEEFVAYLIKIILGRGPGRIVRLACPERILVELDPVGDDLAENHSAQTATGLL